MTPIRSRPAIPIFVQSASTPTAAVRSAARVPLVASGGAGKLADFAPAIRAGADAVLAASVFHADEITVRDVKQAIHEEGFEVRL